MNSRQEILNGIILLKGNLNDLENKLSKFPWDSHMPLVTISKQNLSNVLSKVLNDEISFEYLVKWANTIECRDDIDYETDHLQEIIFDLASPEINGAITRERLNQMVSEIG